MDRYTRWSALLELLARDKRLTVEAAARELAVSEATVRRDFDALAKQRKLVRLRGAAAHHSAPAVAGLLVSALPVASAATRRIAGTVAAQVRPATVVGLAGSTLTSPIARALAVRFEAETTTDTMTLTGSAERRVGVTVVTNDLAIAGDLARRPGLKVVATGGVVDGRSMALAGPLVGLLLQGVAFDSAIIAADAVDPDFGVTAADELQADTCALMIERSRHVIVAAASADLNRTAFASVCGTERVDALVTDTGISPATAERFAHRGVRIVTA